MPLLRKPSPATAIALLALFVALGGPAQAAKLISGAKIKPNSITSRQIKARTLTSSDLSRRTLRSLKRASSSVSSAQLVDGSVSLADLAPGSATGNQVVDRSLSAVDLAADTITAGELAIASVGGAELAANAVTNTKVATGAVSKGSIRPAAVGTEELVDREVRGADLGADTVSVDPPNLDAGKCATFPADVPAQTPATARLVLVGQIADALTLTARATSDTTLTMKACNTQAIDDFDAPSTTLPFVVIGA